MSQFWGEDNRLNTSVWEDTNEPFHDVDPGSGRRCPPAPIKKRNGNISTTTSVADSSDWDEVDREFHKEDASGRRCPPAPSKKRRTESAESAGSDGEPAGDQKTGDQKESTGDQMDFDPFGLKASFKEIAEAIIQPKSSQPEPVQPMTFEQARVELTRIADEVEDLDECEQTRISFTVHFYTKQFLQNHGRPVNLNELVRIHKAVRGSNGSLVPGL